MFPFVETIKCLNGKLINLDYHQRRFDLTRNSFFMEADPIQLDNVVKVASNYSQGLYKCRVLYGSTIQKVEFSEQKNRQIKTLKIVYNNEIDYTYKSTDREKLNQLFAQKGHCDDILIVKNGYLTDSYIANIVLFDGHSWRTPDTPLLKGTQRMRLLEAGIIKSCSVPIEDIARYSHVGLINSFWDLENMPIVPSSAIRVD